LKSEGDRLTGVKKARSHHSLSFLLLPFNGGRKRGGLGGGFNLETFLKEDVLGKDGHYNLRPHHSELA